MRAYGAWSNNIAYYFLIYKTTLAPFKGPVWKRFVEYSVTTYPCVSHYWPRT